MKNKLRKLFSGVLFAVIGSSFFSAAGIAAGAESFYTKVNIWYEKPMEILSTNYHKGTILPVGSEVSILKTGKKITFRDKSTGTKLRLVLVKKYTNLSNEEFFNRYFSKDNFLKGPEFNSFSGSEKENIKNGAFQKGMSKAAVLAAYGYPPTHRTPSTKNSDWTYWKSRFSDFTIHFEGDVLETETQTGSSKKVII